jgi:hypothetical protein
MKQSTEIGNRKTDKTSVYDNFMPHAIKWMDERLAEGQNPADVANVIASIVASKGRHLRYQTSAKGTQTVASRHCDPTGDKSVQEQQLLIQKLWQGPLDSKTGSSYR